MRLTRLLKVVLGLTVISLVYIHLQMIIIDLAYRQQKKEDYVRQLIEKKGNLTYAILKMKSANNLGGKILTDASDMKFVSSENIITISSLPVVDGAEFASNESTQTQSFLSRLSFGLRAEAQIGE